MRPLVNPPKKRVSARRVRVPAPVVPQRHPVFWVACFACSEQVPQLKGPDGKAQLPEGWVTLHPRHRVSKQDQPDVYAAPECIDRAISRLAHAAKIEREDIEFFPLPEGVK